MIISESLVPLDIAKNLKDDFSLVQLESVVKRIRRLFVNKHFHPDEFYNKIISYIIFNYKLKHNDKRVHIVFDHMFSKDNFTIFMITMRVGKLGVPLWFRCFKGKDDSDAFAEELIKQGITHVSNLFNDRFDLIFLADRWFNSTNIMEHIDSLGHTYVLRLRKNLKVLYQGKKDDEKVWKSLGDLPKYKFHATHYNEIELTENRYTTNIVISDSIDTDTPWILATNGDSRRAIKDYSYRFGGIETVFKNQKSNGFYIENTVNCSLKYFQSMYCFSCIGVLLLTIMGANFAKNTKTYNNVKIETHTYANGKKSRIKSLFNTGLTLFHRAFMSLKYTKIDFRFILYDA